MPCESARKPHAGPEQQAASGATIVRERPRRAANQPTAHSGLAMRLERLAHSELRAIERAIEIPRGPALAIAAAAACFQPFLAAALRLLERPDPSFLPPLSCLLTVRQARSSASFFKRRASQPSAICSACGPASTCAHGASLTSKSGSAPKRATCKAGCRDQPDFIPASVPLRVSTFTPVTRPSAPRSNVYRALSRRKVSASVRMSRSGSPAAGTTISLPSRTCEAARAELALVVAELRRCLCALARRRKPSAHSRSRLAPGSIALAISAFRAPIYKPRPAPGRLQPRCPASRLSAPIPARRPRVTTARRSDPEPAGSPATASCPGAGFAHYRPKPACCATYANIRKKRPCTSVRM